MRRKINKQDIIEAGLDIMFEKGYADTGIKDITDRMEIPKGSFYNHFENKEEFGLQVLRFYGERGAKMYEDRLLTSKGTPLGRLKLMFSSIIDNYAPMEYKLGCVMSNFSAELGDTNEEFRKVLDFQFNKHEAVIHQTLVDAKEVGEIPSSIDPKQMASYILNSWHGALVRMKSTANSKPLTDFYDITFNTLLST